MANSSDNQTLPDKDLLVTIEHHEWEKYRTELNLTQQQVADLIGTASGRAIRYYESDDPKTRRKASLASQTLFLLVTGKHPTYKLTRK